MTVRFITSPTLNLQSTYGSFVLGRILCTIPLYGDYTLCFDVLEMVSHEEIASRWRIHHPYFLSRWNDLLRGYFRCG